MRAIEKVQVVVFLFVIATSHVCSSTAQTPSAASILRFGLTSSVIEGDVNPDDAMAATKTWVSTIGKGTGLWNNSDGRIYKDAASTLAAVNRGESDLTAMGTQEYLEVEDSLQAVPSLTYVQGGQVETQYLLLVRNDSGIKTVADLRGKRIALPRSGRNTMAPLWLDVLLYENKLGKKESFFKEVRQVQKPSQAILPVFFSQIDAGIAISSAYATAVELNPQIGQQIRMLSASPKLVMAVVCIRSTLPAGQRERFVKEALKLHEKPAGLQTFNIFKIDRLVAWDSSYFSSVRDLMKKYNLATQPQAHATHIAETGR